MSSDPPEEIVHSGYGCDMCGDAPIVGVKYKCQDCQDFDMCEECHESHAKIHYKGKHEFEKMDKPEPPRRSGHGFIVLQ